jgi:hypothetical protein
MNLKGKYLKGILLLLFFANQFAFAQPEFSVPHDFEVLIGAISKGKNHKRYQFVKKFPEMNNLSDLKVTTEAIDWFGVYRNVIVEKKGESDSLVYIVCHYDKIDGNIFTFVNLLINGNLDIILSATGFTKGSYDNGSGVAISLSLLPWINQQKTHYTYRFLFAGMEEYGLRGSRTHISGLQRDEWNRCFYAINIDMVGKKGNPGISVTENVSFPSLIEIAQKIGKQNNIQIQTARMPHGALSDYYFFYGQNFSKDFTFSFMVNLTGALFPQRSYFTRPKKAVPVISFTDNEKITASDLLSSFSPFAFGQVHSFRDNPEIVDARNLLEYNRFIKLFILYLESSKKLF